MTNLTTMNILSIADALQEKMNEYKVTERCALNFIVTHEDFMKLDEDMYYRLNENASEDGYVPSEGFSIITYGGVDITICEDGGV